MSSALSTADLILLVAYLLGVVAFGIWTGRRVKGVSDFFVGSRNLPWGAVLFSIVATETSTVTFLSVPGIAWAEGGDLTFLQLPLGYVVGRLLVVALLLPLYFKGKIYTAYEVLGRRFGGYVKQAASLLFIATRTLADGLRLYLTALVLSKVAGLDQRLSVLAVGVATIAYTFCGGIRAVVWTDCIQFAVYIGGALLAGSLLLDSLPGGLDGLLETARSHDKLNWLDFELAFDRPYTFWAGVVGGAFFSLGTHGVDQMMVQRYLCARSLPKASLALGLSGVVVFAQFALFLALGIGLFAFYREFPPERPFQQGDEVFASFIVDHLKVPVGALGIVLGGVFSAAMSTLSSSLNSAASAVVNDFYRPRRPDTSPERLLSISRWLTVGFGAAQIGVGLSGPWGGGVIGNVLAIASFTTGITLGIFFLGIFDRRADSRAALIALAVGLAGMSTVAFATPLAWPWFTLVGSLGTLAVGSTAARLLR